MLDSFADKLIILSGPSGAGKDTIAGRLLELDDRFSLSVSATTRKPRGNEVDGEDYYFLSENDFERVIADDGFIEYAKYGGNYYGTLVSDVKKRTDSGKTVILVIEVNGAAKVRKKYPGVLSIFIMPPSREVLEHRLRKRQTESEEAIQKRIVEATNEINRKDEYDEAVVNDDLDTCVENVYNIIIKNRKG